MPVARNLKLAADYGEVAIRDQVNGVVTARDEGLSDALAAELDEWNERYQRVIPASHEERVREPMASLIAALDREGVRLARMLADAVDGPVKIQYYSEGLLRDLPL